MNEIEKANRALWAACMGNMRLASSWLSQAQQAVAQHQTEAMFIVHSHAANRNKARAAFRLAQLEAK